MAIKSATETKPPKPLVFVNTLSGIALLGSGARLENLPKPRSQDHIAYWKKHGHDVHRCDTPQGLADFLFAVEATDLDLPNLIPGRDEAPEFRLVGEEETPADRARFAEFLDRHFPRTDEKFAPLRSKLDMYARVTEGGRASPMEIEIYQRIFDERQLQRALAKRGERIARATGMPFPLRICSCGLLFLASRPNVKWHSKACGSRARMAKARTIDGKIADYEMKSEQKKDAKEKAAKEYERKHRKGKGAAR
jgi:hypothetical protein